MCVLGTLLVLDFRWLQLCYSLFLLLKVWWQVVKLFLLQLLVVRDSWSNVCIEAVAEFNDKIKLIKSRKDQTCNNGLAKLATHEFRAVSQATEDLNQNWWLPHSNTLASCNQVPFLFPVRVELGTEMGCVHPLKPRFGWVILQLHRHLQLSVHLLWSPLSPHLSKGHYFWLKLQFCYPTSLWVEQTTKRTFKNY